MAKKAKKSGRRFFGETAKSAARNTAAKRSAPRKSARSTSRGSVDRAAAKGAVKKSAARGKAKTSRRKSGSGSAQDDLQAVTLALHRAGIPLINADGQACATVAERVQLALDRLASVGSVGSVQSSSAP